MGLQPDGQVGELWQTLVGVLELASFTRLSPALRQLLDELLLLTAHGLLHLLGFDHAEPEEEREMFGIQRDILVGFHISERRR